MQLCLTVCLECSVCEQPMATNQLFDQLHHPSNDSVTAFLLTVASGLCPCCGTIVRRGGQTPDSVIQRYNKLLRERTP